MGGLKEEEFAHQKAASGAASWRMFLKSDGVLYLVLTFLPEAGLVRSEGWLFPEEGGGDGQWLRTERLEGHPGTHLG